MFDYSSPSFHPVSQLRKFTIILCAYLGVVGSAFQWLIRRWTTNLTAFRRKQKEWNYFYPRMITVIENAYHRFIFKSFQFSTLMLTINISIYHTRYTIHFIYTFCRKSIDSHTDSLYIIYIKLFYTKLKRKFALSFRGSPKSKHISFETDRKSWIRSDHRTSSSRTINFSIEDRSSCEIATKTVSVNEGG